MDSQIARLIVLHEDLKIEAVGAVRKKTLLDYAGVGYRRFYFVRASLQTFREAMKDAYMHLTNATHTLAICYLLPRIEGR